jgi:hypothetical protein
VPFNPGSQIIFPRTLKILKLFDADPGPFRHWIRDPGLKNSDPGSRARNKHPRSATLICVGETATIDTLYCMVQYGALMNFMCSNLLWNSLITKTESVLISIYNSKNKTQNQLTSATGLNKQEKIGFSVSSSS